MVYFQFSSGVGQELPLACSAFQVAGIDSVLPHTLDWEEPKYELQEAGIKWRKKK
jgi:hypothetical protein